MKGRRYTVCAAILLSGLLLLTGCEKTEGGEISREMPATGEKMKESEVQAKKSGEKNAEEEKAETEEKNGPEETKKDTEVEEAPKTVLQTDIRICISETESRGIPCIHRTARCSWISITGAAHHAGIIRCVTGGK